jgi:putative DNA primase/helicase
MNQAHHRGSPMTVVVTIESLLRALGGEKNGNGILCPSPGHSARDRGMRVWPDPNDAMGFKTCRFNGNVDDWQGDKDHVTRALGMPEWRPGQRRPQPTRSQLRVRQAVVDANARAMIELAAECWRKTVPLKGTLVETYLNARDIALPDDVVDADVIRFDPECVFKLLDGTRIRLPAMIARMNDALTDEFIGIHRTALRPDGSGKADVPGLGNPKKMLGGSGPIKLCADDTVEFGLGISEGIENGLTVICAGWRPVWAAGAAGNITTFPVLPAVEALTVFADNDPKDTGQGAANACAQRWLAAGREVHIYTPSAPAGGKSDWNDVIRRVGRENS